MAIPRKSAAIAALVVAVLATDAARGHDFYLEPTPFRPRVSQPVSLSLVEVNGLQIQTIPHYGPSVEAFVLASPDGRVPIEAVTGDDPIAEINPAAGGFHVIGHQTKGRRVELPLEKFRKYVEDRGLDEVAGLLGPGRQDAPPVREIFSRYAKTILAVGDHPADRNFETRLGWRMELVPHGNLYRWESAKPVSLELLFEGKPLPGVLVVAHARDDWDEQIEGRTDGRGLVDLAIPHPGAWVAMAVHMQRGSAATDVDWESFWASLLFEAGGD